MQTGFKPTETWLKPAETGPKSVETEGKYGRWESKLVATGTKGSQTDVKSVWFYNKLGCSLSFA